MSLARKVAHNTIIQAGGKIIGTILAVGTIFFLARYLGDFGYGQYTTIIVYLQIFSILMDLGLFIILIKKLAQAKSPEQENIFINNTFTFRLASGLFFLSIAVVIALFIPQYDAIIKWGILITAVNFLFVSLNQLLTVIYQKHLAMMRVALAEIVGKIFLFLSVLSVIYIFHSGLLSVMLAVVIGGTVNFLMLYSGTLKYYKLKLAFDFKIWRDLINASWPIALSISLNMIYFKADTLLLGILQTQKEVGIYGAPYKVLEVIITLPAMFVGLVMPILSSAYEKKDLEKFRKVLHKSFDAIFIMILPLIAGAIMLAQPLMIFVTGKDFTANIQDLGKLLQILIWAVAFIFIGTLTGYLIVILNKQKSAIKAYGFVALTSLIGYLIFIPKYSYFGAAAVTVYSELAMVLFGLYYIYSSTKILPRWQVFSKAFLASGIMMLVLYFTVNLNIFIQIIIGAGVYFVSLYLLGGISKQEASDIINTKN
ncbi:MAG: flippase [Patescibacteria group bacterium]